MECIVVLERWAWKDTLDDLPGNGYGVVFLEVEFSRGRADHVGRHIVPSVGGEGLAVDLDC